MSKCTILIKSITRDRLKEIGKKGQTYDELIDNLIKIKRNTPDSPDRRIETLQSSESIST